MSNFGITASRDGPTVKQVVALSNIMAGIAAITPLFYESGETEPVKSVLHHGDCIGGDELAHDLAKLYGFLTHGHPPINNKLRAYRRCDFMEKPLPYIQRNHNIVDSVGRLWVLPNTFDEQLRSGTWATWRYAKKRHVLYTIIFPNGSTTSG